jgi:hypothetical protein
MSTKLDLKIKLDRYKMNTLPAHVVEKYSRMITGEDLAAHHSRLALSGVNVELNRKLSISHLCSLHSFVKFGIEQLFKMEKRLLSRGYPHLLNDYQLPLIDDAIILPKQGYPHLTSTQRDDLSEFFEGFGFIIIGKYHVREYVSVFEEFDAFQYHDLLQDSLYYSTDIEHPDEGPAAVVQLAERKDGSIRHHITLDFHSDLAHVENYLEYMYIPRKLCLFKCNQRVARHIARYMSNKRPALSVSIVNDGTFTYSTDLTNFYQAIHYRVNTRDVAVRQGHARLSLNCGPLVENVSLGGFNGIHLSGCVNLRSVDTKGSSTQCYRENLPTPEWYFDLSALTVGKSTFIMDRLKIEFESKYHDEFEEMTDILINNTKFPQD